MSRFVRASKYRHVFGTGSKREQCYDNLKVTRSAHDANQLQVNPLFFSLNWEAAGGGAFCVWPLDKIGKLPTDAPLMIGHTNTVLDTDFNPFNDYVVASGGEDCKVMVWSIPEGGPSENVSPALVLNGHGRKVGNVQFHPTAENLLASASFDLTVKLWDINKGMEKQELLGHLDFVQSMSYNYNGTLLATTSKDKKLRIFDVRSGKVTMETEAHPGIKGCRCVWLGEGNKVATTGFSKQSERQLSFWDVSNGLSSSIKTDNLDSSSGVLMPFYDNDTKVLYLAGKGDGNIRYYEMVDEEPHSYYLSEYKSSEPQKGMAFLPKRAVNVNECEVVRLFKLTTSYIEPISFKVPRKSDVFQSDIFPETNSDKPALNVDEFFAGKTADPIKISLERGYVPPAKKEFVTTGSKDINSGGAGNVEENKVLTEKELREAYHQLRRENEDLKNSLAQKDVTIRQLEVQLESLKSK